MKRYINLILGILFYISALVVSYFIDREMLGLILFISSYLLVGYSVIYSAYLSIKEGEIFSEYFLMTLATLGAFLLQEYPEAVAVMLFYKIGELFENYAVGKSRKSIAEIMAIRPEMARVIHNGQVLTLSPEKVTLGEHILVHAGERVPLDGIVLEGSAHLDSSALTGESLPIVVEKGSEILSGTLNLDGVLEIEVTKVFAESTVNRILDMVELASMRKSKREQFITKFARYYTPVVVIGAVLLATVPNFFTGFTMWQEWLYRSLIFLVVSCPCALVVSVPLSFFGGIGGASKRGILVKGSNYLEALAEVDSMVFDKTGTITKGILEVESILPQGVSQEALLELMAEIEFHSNHPLAKAVLNRYEKGLEKSRVINVSEIGGRGLKGLLDGADILCGNEALMRENHIKVMTPLENTCIHLAYKGEYLGAVTFSDQLKPEAKEALLQLKASGVKNLVMLTGDKTAVAQSFKDVLGFNRVYGDLLPGDKLTHVEALLKQNRGTLAFVGDGINDAPVLARADLGIAMGAMGSDAAIEASDIVIMDDNLNRLAEGIGIAKKTVCIAKQNTVLAIGIKVGVLILSIFGLANLWLGVFADVGVTVLAVLNALRSLSSK